MQSKAQDSAKVVRVKDGDTYMLATGTRTFTVRLENVDAPENKQKGGSEATLFVQNILMGRTVIYDSAGMDRYGRVLASISVDGKRLDSLIIGAGMGWQYIQYNHETMLHNLMQNAITNKVGLWACGTSSVCPPWLWRHFNNRNRLLYCNGCKY